MNEYNDFCYQCREAIGPDCQHQFTHRRDWHEEGDPFVTIIAFWPVEEVDRKGYDNRWISRCHLRTACAQAHFNLQIIERPEQAVIPEGVPIIGLEEPYEILDTERKVKATSMVKTSNILTFSHPRDAVYIVGNTFYQRPSDHFDTAISLGMPVYDEEIANYSPLYGDQMVSIIWYDRLVKNGIV